MAKKKRIHNGKPASQGITVPGGASGMIEAAKAVAANNSSARNTVKNAMAAMLPAEVQRGDWTVLILALMIFLTPAVGVPHEEMLQDTLKSIVASFAAIFAGLLFFWHQRNRRDGLRWHSIMWVPLTLMVYALGSMVWSHTYLGGVEAIRWFIFSLILWLGLNTLSRERLHYVIEGIHWGAVVASLWTALQFWVDFTFFPQGPNPASTFVNRNFFAEFVVCTIPFSIYLLAQAKSSARVTLLAFTVGFNIIALMMTGTRGALTAMWILLGGVFPVILFLYRKQLGFFKWDSGRRILACGVLLATVVSMGMIKTNNPRLIADGQSFSMGITPFERAFARTASISAGDGSLGIRFIMWKATGRLIKARPWTGVGAGAWEAYLPLYQSEGSQLETDYYVHNEILQLLAEYGVTGLLVLLGLLGYLLFAAWKTVRDRTTEGLSEAPVRAVALASLLAFLIVSNIGFPWRLASTDCMFALCLALLASSDARLQIGGVAGAHRLAWRPAYSQIMAVFMICALAMAVYISQQAALTEQKIVKAVKLSLGITQSQDYGNPKWDKVKKEIVTLTRDAVSINTHYRKITPMVADEMAKWGDWNNAIWIWESVTKSRPYVVAIMSNIARGYAQLGNNEKALEYLARCEKLQPKAPSVRSLKIILMSRTGKEPEAALLAKQSMDDGIVDYDLVNAAYVLGMRKADYEMVMQSLQLRLANWPNLKSDTLIKIGSIYQNQKGDQTKALESYKAALEAAPPAEKESVRKQIPPAFLAKM